jgi:hypothetical protein
MVAEELAELLELLAPLAADPQPNQPCSRMKPYP